VEESDEMDFETVNFLEAAWHNPPARRQVSADAATFQPEEGSDFWQQTSYGFSRDSGQALLMPLRRPAAMEVTFEGTFANQFDQAGLLLRVNDVLWLKAGVEFADGVLCAGAVVTRGTSDWSLAPSREWSGGPMVVRVSLSDDVAIVRARVAGGDWKLLRVAPFELNPHAVVSGGPYACCPSRAGLVARFSAWRVSAPDLSPHAMSAASGVERPLS
jgi:regulation of enolase protein 1 (concanavalin A-like superfamily)